MTSCEAIRLLCRRNNKCPCLLIADIAATPPRLPVTLLLEFGHMATMFATSWYEPLSS